MKQFVWLACALGFVVSSFAQSTSLYISTDKTTSLIFPYPIRHVDRGNKDVLVQPVKEADNILLVKAASKDFPETNISIITGDGSVYSFAVFYGQSSVWVYHFPSQLKTSIAVYANSILDNPGTIKGIKNKSWDMEASVSGIYIKDGIMYYQLRLINGGAIDYNINFLRFYIRDKNKTRRTAIQETEITPLYTGGNTSEVKANSESSVVFAFDKFTIPDAKCLAIEIGEKNGGRTLVMKVGNKKIIKAIPLPDMK